MSALQLLADCGLGIAATGFALATLAIVTGVGPAGALRRRASAT
jgi:hypothetical protein